MTFLWGAWNGAIALHLRQDPLGLTDEQLIAALEAGRRMIIGVARLVPGDPGPPQH